MKSAGKGGLDSEGRQKAAMQQGQKDAYVIWDQGLALPSTSWVTLARPFQPQFPSLYNGDKDASMWNEQLMETLTNADHSSGRGAKK